MPKGRTTFKVVHEYEVSVDIGELPPHSIAALLERDITEQEPHLWLGNTDWSIPGDVGSVNTSSVSVAPKGAE